MEWEGRQYIDPALPFGLRSAPKVFNAIAEALEWILKSQGISCLMHYLDDFVTVGALGSGECLRNMASMSQICQQLGAPLATEIM